MSRSYHNLTAHFNAYFNGKESMKTGVKKINDANKDDFDRILPVTTYSKSENVSSAFPDMDNSIKKASKVIKLHSITAKPKRKTSKMSKKKKEFYQRPEFCKWVDNSYMLMGKAHFFRQDYFQATQNFEYIISRFDKDEIIYDAMLWMARVYIEENKYDLAKEMFDRLEGDKEFPKRLKGELELVYADFFTKQEKYEDAVPRLLKAIEKSKNKTEKTRLKFILAQIYQRKKEYNSASNLYAEVIKRNPPYEMAFNAKINRAESFSSGNGDKNEIKKQLTKMLRDDKNIDYQDQIYYSLANIELKEKNTDQAIKYYLLSAKTSISNPNQQALSYLALADIYFVRPDYPKAQQYYDSTMTFLNNTYPGYDELHTKTVHLNELIENLNIIYYEDSVQKLRNLPQKELDKIIEDRIAEVIREEEKQKELLEQQQMDRLLLMQNQQNKGGFANGSGDNQGGKWYFYNQMTVGSGIAEFKRKWGTRKLEDNWRRKNKTVISVDVLADDSGNPADSTKKTTKVDKKSKDYYMKGIPFSDTALLASNERIYEAMYNAGRVYKDKLYDYPESIKSFEGLIARNENTDFTLSTFYYLYKINKLIKNEDRAEYYKNLIVTKFPESSYASMLTNPNYIAELEAEKALANKLYTQTYVSYLQGDYKSVLTGCNYADSAYKEHVLIPKFALLRALAIGKVSSIDNFKMALNGVINKYPDTEEKTEAQHYLDYVSNVKLDSLQNHLASLQLTNNNTNNNNTTNYTNLINNSVNPDTTSSQTVEKELYKTNEKDAHFYIVVVDKNDVDVNRIRFNISSYNIDFFSMFDFTISRPIILDGNVQMISVKTFIDKEQAMKYYRSVLANPDIYSGLQPTQYRQFVISAENYPVFFSDKNVTTYMKFFKKNYLGE